MLSGKILKGILLKGGGNLLVCNREVQYNQKHPTEHSPKASSLLAAMHRPTPALQLGLLHKVLYSGGQEIPACTLPPGKWIKM